MNTETALCQAIEPSPGDELAWLALADWLEEQGQSDRAEVLRLVLSLTRKPRSAGRKARERRLRELLAGGARPYMPTLTLPIGMSLVLVPPGAFWMGSPEREEGRYDPEGPRHTVRVTEGYYLGAHPVTQSQWRAVMGRNPSKFKGDDRPVENVSWDDCQRFCTKLSQQVGRLVRLPTEAEWEYACRAGTTTAYHTGDNLDAMKQAGWCSYNGHFGSGKETKPVGQFLPNGFGLYDMHGNVWEWCADHYVPYSDSEAEDAESEEDMVQRGGSWYTTASGCRSAFRGDNPASLRDAYFGCRVAISLD
jgi:uncharacterized protein (TIGR02996 family)